MAGQPTLRTPLRHIGFNNALKKGNRPLRKTLFLGGMLGGGRLTSHHLFLSFRIIEPRDGSSHRCWAHHPRRTSCHADSVPGKRRRLTKTFLVFSGGNTFFQHKGSRYMNIMMNFVNRSGAQW